MWGGHGSVDALGILVVKERVGLVHGIRTCDRFEDLGVLLSGLGGRGGYATQVHNVRVRGQQPCVARAPQLDAVGRHGLAVLEDEVHLPRGGGGNAQPRYKVAQRLPKHGAAVVELGC